MKHPSTLCLSFATCYLLPGSWYAPRQSHDGRARSTSISPKPHNTDMILQTFAAAAARAAMKAARLTAAFKVGHVWAKAEKLRNPPMRPSLALHGLSSKHPLRFRILFAFFGTVPSASKVVRMRKETTSALLKASALLISTCSRAAVRVQLVTTSSKQPMSQRLSQHRSFQHPLPQDGSGS